MFNWLLSTLAVKFVVSTGSSGSVFVGTKNPASTEEPVSWRSHQWRLEGGVSRPIRSLTRPALAIRATSPNCYWHTDPFVSTREDGKIVVRFQLKSSSALSRHRIYIFEDGTYHSVGEVIADREWRNFEIPISAKPGSILEFQIDQLDDWQWMLFRDFRVLDGASVPLTKQARSLPVEEITPDENKISENESLRSQPIPKPSPLTPLDGSGRSLTPAESQYYFYQAGKALQRRAREQGMDLILYLMPDPDIARLMPAIRRLRAEGVKIIAYELHSSWNDGPEMSLYWHRADSHWTEAAVRLTADEILDMWQNNKVENRPLSPELMAAYSAGFPKRVSAGPS